MNKLSMSVITPSYNQGEFIEQTIRSVLDQNIEGLQYLVVDGGSSDQTLEVLKKYQGQITWSSAKDGGQAQAVNKGLKMATGEIIGWLNSDDLYAPQALKQVSTFFEENPYVDFVYGKTQHIDSQGKNLDFYLTEPWNLERLKECCFISQPATFFRRSVFEKYGLLNEKLNLCLDYEFWLRSALRGAKFAYLPTILAASRIHAATKSSRCFLESHFETINMLQETLGYIPSEWVVNYSTAKVKESSCFKYPHPAFFMASWRNLWHTAGLYNHGIARIRVWLAAQKVITKKLLAKLAHSL